MNKLIWPFIICYFLSFDAMVRNPIAGYVAFMGSAIGVTSILWTYNYPPKDIKTKKK